MEFIFNFHFFCKCLKHFFLYSTYIVMPVAGQLLTYKIICGQTVYNSIIIYDQNYCVNYYLQPTFIFSSKYTYISYNMITTQSPRVNVNNSKVYIYSACILLQFYVKPLQYCIKSSRLEHIPRSRFKKTYQRQMTSISIIIGSRLL